MSQIETDFSTSPIEITSPPSNAHTSSSGSGPPTAISKSRQNTTSPPSNGASGSQPNPRSCITCRKRKVRCDKQHPCSNCSKAGIECIFPGPGRAPRRSRKPPDAELLARLRRLEGVVSTLGKTVDEDGSVGADADDEKNGAMTTDTEKEEKPKDEHVPKRCGLFNGPEPRKDNADGVSKEFGRLVVEEGRSRYVSNKFWNSLGEEIAEMRDILDDPTDDEDDYPSPGSGSSASANHQGFIFSFSSTILSLRNFHPPANQIMTYWEIYKENVDPLVKIFHRPCTEKTLRDATKDLDHISKPLETLMFSVYFAAVTSLSEEDCTNVIGMDKDSALKKYRFGFEQAMARAGFLSTTELVVLQAFTIFLICVRRHDDTRFVWTLTGLLIRLAQSLGVHRDGEQFGLMPLETELRRRLWWQIVHLDLRASEDHGSDPTILEESFDTRFPLNINDEDINGSMKEPPPEHEGATEMTFDLIRYTVSTTARRISYVPPGPGKCRERSKNFTLEHKERLIEDLHQHIENRFLKHCDMNIPLHWVAGTVLRLVLAKMWLIVHHPLQREDLGKELSEETNERLFNTSVEVVEWSHLLETEKSTKKWGWLFRTYVQWHAVAFVLSQLCVRTKGPEVDKAWHVIEHVLGDYGGMVSMTKRGMLWKPLRKLLAKAQAVQAREVQKAAMFPLDGSLGPAVPPHGAAVDPMGMNGAVNFPFTYDNNLPTSNNNGLPNITQAANPLQTYVSMDQPQRQLSLSDNGKWMYNDPAFPQIVQGLGGNPMDGVDATGGDVNWTSWDDMMENFPMSTSQDPSFNPGPMMGGMTNWW